MDEISISLVDSFCRWPQGVFIHKSGVFIFRICTQIPDEIVRAKTYITVLHDMRTIGRIFICSPRFDL